MQNAKYIPVTSRSPYPICGSGKRPSAVTTLLQGYPNSVLQGNFGRSESN